ncbi:hypothetical protein SEPCBS57363_002155 [Sporothrix epigloea]|uniref:Retrotransposon gag domain-containing protein n=1 Tax=Sporothrix epigloea TaxID=1892477 RepID=A0ABP0DEA6_9PEZI
MTEFRSTFSGLAGEDPSEYLEDLELWATRYLKDLSDDQRDIAKRSAFRQGLQGNARYGWYLELPTKNREWTILQTLFKEYFNLELRLYRRGVGDQVRAFRREPGESIASFLTRADVLIKRCNPRQSVTLRDCIYYGIGQSDADCLLRYLTVLHLQNANKVGMHSELHESCTYWAVRQKIESAAIPLGVETRLCAGSGESCSTDLTGGHTPHHEHRDETARALRHLADTLEKVSLAQQTSKPVCGMPTGPDSCKSTGKGTKVDGQSLKDSNVRTTDTARLPTDAGGASWNGFRAPSLMARIRNVQNFESASPLSTGVGGSAQDLFCAGTKTPDIETDTCISKSDYDLISDYSKTDSNSASQSATATT